MESRRYITHKFKTAKRFMYGKNECNAFELTVSYVKGGISWWDGHRYPSGYRVSFTPGNLEDFGYGNSFSMMIGDGFYAQAETAERFSASKMEAIHKALCDDFDGWLRDHGLGSIVDMGYEEA